MSPRSRTHQRWGGGIWIESNFERLERLGREQLARSQLALRETLLEGVAKKRAQGMFVRLEAIRPEVAAHQLLGFLDMGKKPGKHKFEGGSLVQVIIDIALRSEERF